MSVSLTHAPLLAALLLAAGAAPPPRQYALTQPDPVSPRVVAPPRPEFVPAPMPDPDAFNPALRGSTAHAALTPGLYRPNGTLVQGEGFTPNSTVRGEQQRHYRPAPAVSLSVPLQ